MEAIDIFILSLILLVVVLSVAIVILLKDRDKNHFSGKMRNFPVIVDGREFWISRACAVVGVMLKRSKSGNELMVLANKRGPGCPDFVGYWNLPCGYIDYDETLQEAIVREVYEETGLVTKPENWEFISINSDPKKSNRQNITTRWLAIYDESMGTFNTEHSEKNEVDDVRWIPLDDTDKYNWAFDQDELLKEIKASIEPSKA